MIIDWSDGALGHPFQDLATYLNRTEDVGLRRRLLDAYLAGWPDVPRAELDEAARLGLIVGSLPQVESYRRIIESLEPDEDWAPPAGCPGSRGGLWPGSRTASRHRSSAEGSVAAPRGGNRRQSALGRVIAAGSIAASNASAVR